jgi:hypothetical protein
LFNCNLILLVLLSSARSSLSILQHKLLVFRLFLKLLHKVSLRQLQGSCLLSKLLPPGSPAASIVFAPCLTPSSSYYPFLQISDISTTRRHKRGPIPRASRRRNEDTQSPSPPKFQASATSTVHTPSSDVHADASHPVPLHLSSLAWNANSSLTSTSHMSSD